MTGAPILRSATLQRALAAATGRTAPPVANPSSFASTLAKAQSRTSPASPATTRPTPPRTSDIAVAGVQAPAPAAVTGSVPFANEIEAAAKRHGVDPALLAGLVKAESNFNPNAQSGVGAKGLTQLMDATAKGLGVTNSFDPAQSLEAGAKFLGGLLKQFNGDERLALAAYNAGPGAVKKFGGIPPYQETQRYVPKVLGFADQFRRIWADSTGSKNA